MPEKKSKSKPSTPKAKKKAKSLDVVSSKEDRFSGRRIGVDLLVSYRSKGNYLFDFCRNLGSGGIFLKTEEPLTPGEELELTFTIPNSSEVILTKGQVMWAQQNVKNRPELIPGMGVQFVGCTETDRKKLDDLVATYNANYAPKQQDKKKIKQA